MSQTRRLSALAVTTAAITLSVGAWVTHSSSQEKEKDSEEIVISGRVGSWRGGKWRAAGEALIYVKSGPTGKSRTPVKVEKDGTFKFKVQRSNFPPPLLLTFKKDDRSPAFLMTAGGPCQLDVAMPQDAATEREIRTVLNELMKNEYKER
jgi:hypothetical protein